MNSSARGLKDQSLTESPQEWNKVRSFKRRGKRITPGQQSAYEAGWSKWGIADVTELANLDAMFSGRPVLLEIGFGMGEATAIMADQQRDVGLIAIDIHRPGIGALLREIDVRKLENLRILDGDITEVLHHLAPSSLAGVRIFFPDPWPKKKHHKRRLIQSDFIAAITTKLIPGGFLHAASDWVPYAEWIKEVLDREAALEGGAIARPPERPLTRFESQGIGKGHQVTDLYYRRK
jgi:tRNA (guanine-N7-)-methyltransferase